MKIIFLPLCLFALAQTIKAQDYKRFVEREAVPARSYGAPLFNRADSTGKVAQIVPSGKKCFVISQEGPYFRVKVDGSSIYYAVASSLVLPGSKGHETAEPVTGTNTVVVFTPDAPADAWARTCQLLLGEGYSLAQHESDLRSFATAPKAIGNAMQLTITGFVQPSAGGHGSEVIFLGSYSYIAATMGGFGGINTTNVSRPVILTNGLSQAADRKAFVLIDKVAHAYPSAVVKYGFR